jgi:hypothetical protein
VWAAALGACAGGEEADDRGWTVSQAESIRSVRGLPVRVWHCRGLGAALRNGDVLRYDRFACVAGARLPQEEVDTVAVLYELDAQDASSYELREVRFIGGPGIP